MQIYVNENEIYKSSSILTINKEINYNLLIDLNYTKELVKNLQINDKNLKIVILTDFNDKLFILNIVLIIMLIIGFLVLSTTISLSGNITKKMFMPIKEIIESAKNITGNKLDQRIISSDSYDDLKELSDTFNQMMDRIQSSHDKQKQFVSDASHELRTPISVIQGYINMLDRWGKDDKKILDESIEAIKNESKDMERLVNSLLFLARIDKNTQNLEKEEFRVDELIVELVKETSMIDTNHIIKNSNTENIIINADRALIKQAIRVFIQNSIKYTPENGEITLDSYSKGNSIYILIKDTGMGISKEDLPNVFNRFFRADSSRAKNTGGVGLGLSIAKWIIDFHGGIIDLRSVEGVGTKVIIRLPYKELR